MEFTINVVTAAGPRTIFTDEGVEKLREMRAANLPVKEIAKTLGAKTRTVQSKIETMRLVKPQSSPWNQDATELLKKLWSEGLSASQCARRLGGLTRNSVISKVHRLGLEGRKTTTRSASRKRDIANARAARTKPKFTRRGNPAFRALLETEPVAPPAEDLFIPVKQRRTIETLEECHCRWPCGDVGTPEFHYCGGQKLKGLPYCEFHSRRAFVAPDPRRRLRPALEGRNETYVQTLDRVLEQVGSK